MAKRISESKRIAITEYYRDNMVTVIATAKKFGVTPNSVLRFVKEQEIQVDSQRNRRGKTAWNKGGTKETDNRIAAYAKTKSKSYKLDGYRMVWCDELQKSVREHHYMWFKNTGIWPNTKKGEQIHHIDNNKLNNEIENLHLTTISKHSAIHKLYEQIAVDLIKAGYISFNKDTETLNTEKLWEALNNEKLGL